jgi:hypothetical protein
VNHYGCCSHTLNGTDSQPWLGAKADWGLRYRIYYGHKNKDHKAPVTR